MANLTKKSCWENRSKWIFYFYLFFPTKFSNWNPIFISRWFWDTHVSSLALWWSRTTTSISRWVFWIVAWAKKIYWISGGELVSSSDHAKLGDASITNDARHSLTKTCHGKFNLCFERIVSIHFQAVTEPHWLNEISLEWNECQATLTVYLWK